MSAKVHPEPGKARKESIITTLIKGITGQTKTSPTKKHVRLGSIASTQRNNSVAASTEDVHKFGEIHFWRNFGYDVEGRPFLRVNHDCNMEEVCKVLTQEWKLPTPRIVLLLISNVAPLSQWNNTRQIRSFQTGLIDAANTTDMWILTNGMNIGLTKAVGDAVQEEIQRRLSKGSGNQSNPGIVLMGVAREDILNHADLFNGKNKRVELENEGNRLDEQKFDLNPDHSHFLIVKDSTINKSGINYFLMRLQQFLSHSLEHPRKSAALSRKASQICLGHLEIPVVAVLMQGGKNCARLVVDHLKKHFPLVVMKGSGGLADLLSFAYTEISQRPQGIADAEFTENYLKPELSRKITEKFANLQDNSLTRNLLRDRVMDCIRFAKLNEQIYLTVINMHEHSCNLDNLGNLLLRALFKSQKTDTNWHAQMHKDLYLTLDWNSPNVAMSEVFQKDPSSKFKIEKEIFEEALLRTHREHFVDLFLNQGFQIHKYLTPKRLTYLFKRMQYQEFFQSVCWEGALSYGPMSRMGRDFLEKDLNFLLEKTTGIPEFVVLQELYLNCMGMYVGDPAAAERKAKVLLTFWATLTYNIPLAKVLWKHADQPVHLALVLSMMIDKLIPFANETTLRVEMEHSSSDFANIATLMLDACYNDNPSKAFDVLNEENPEWGLSTAVDIAAQARNRRFLSHICCQKWLTNMFYGKIRIRDLSWGVFVVPSYIKILLCAFLVFPMYMWIVFETGEYTLNEDDKEPIDPESDDEKDDALLLQNGAVPSTKNNEEIKSVKEDNNNNRSWRRAEYLKNFLVPHPPVWKMIYLLWNAPITKFWTFQVFYILYLALLSIAVMWPSCGNHRVDLIVIPWTALLTLESLHPAIRMRKKRKSTTFFLKITETVAMTLFVVVYTLGRIVKVEFLNPYTMRVILCFGLLYFYYRIIAIFLPISPTLGPLLYRVKLMVLVDFVNFMRMALLVIISGGIVIHAVMYPDYPFNQELFRRTFHKAWFSLFMTPIGDLIVDPTCSKIQGRTLNNSFCLAGHYVDVTCAHVGFWTYIFNIQYFILLKLILLTLLYALFSATATKLSAESDAIWKFQRYHLVVDFSNRLKLPPPLNLISYIIMTCQLMVCIFKHVLCFVFQKCKSGNSGNKSRRYSIKDYSYWNQLAQEYFTKELKKESEWDLLQKQVDLVQNLMEDFKYQKQMMHQLKASVRELERLMNYSHVHLENIRHLTSRDNAITGQWEGLVDANKRVVKPIMNILARRSPFPGTRVQRFPVPDKYVPWEVMWISYDPVAFTQPKIDFPVTLQSYVDEDILLLRERQATTKRALPVYAWNSVSVNPTGIGLDRQSWIAASDGSPLIYRLDSEEVPQNPMGRTGLRGRGSLPRWGPNHYVLVIITRFQRIKESLLTNRGLEFVVLWTERRFQLSIPGGFVSGEYRYEVIRAMFKNNVTGNTLWQQADVVTQFFKERVKPAPAPPPDQEQKAGETSDNKVHCKIVHKGYMDDPLNTDHAWKEVELWHVHYDTPENISEHLQPMMGWRLITEDAFFKLPAGQAVMLQDIAREMKAAIL